MVKQLVKKRVGKEFEKDVSKQPSVSDTSPLIPPGGTALYVGIDLGTCRASVSASNGVREVVPTYVGYPKDNVSEELLGAEPLFGELALKHRLSVELVRPLAVRCKTPRTRHSRSVGPPSPTFRRHERGCAGLGGPALQFCTGLLAHGIIQTNKSGDNKYLTAAQQLVRHLLALVQSEPGEPVYGVIGAPARASIASQRVLVDAARGILDAVMIVSEPFAVAYGLRILDQALIVDIGPGTVDLCRLHGTLPLEEDQITLDEAGDFVDERLSTLIGKKYPEVQFNVNMVRALKERYGCVLQNPDRVVARFPVKGRPAECDITDELVEACSSIVAGIVDSIAELIATYAPEFQEFIRSRVILAGGGSQMIGLRTLIERGMEELGGGRVTRVEEPLFAGSNGALRMSQRMPKRFWKMLA